MALGGDAFGQHDGDATGHDGGLAGARAGLDQDRAIMEADRVAARAVVREQLWTRCSSLRLPDLSDVAEPLGRGGELALAIGGAGVRRQGEGEVVIVAAGVRARQRRAAGERLVLAARR